MKIGIIAHDAHPICEPFQGGLEMLTYLLVNELAKRGHSVTTLCHKGSTIEGKLVYYSTNFEGCNSENELLPLDAFGNFYQSITEFLQQDFDVIHNNSLNHHAIAVGSLCKIPFISSFHTPVFDNLNVAIRAVKKTPNQIFTAVSNSLKAVYEEFLDDVETVYNGIDLKAWKTSSDKQNYLSWCGRICKEKGLLEIMDLCHQNKISIKIAGPIANKDYYELHIEPRLRFYDECDYVGHLNQKEVNNLVAKSKAFLFTSTWAEPYGLVIAEALASGTPVIANNIGAASEIVTINSGILFNLENSKSFFDAVSKIESIDPNACRKRAEEFCSHHLMVDKYERIYERVMSNAIILS